jgi:hypothetical protein
VRVPEVPAVLTLIWYGFTSLCLGLTAASFVGVGDLRAALLGATAVLTVVFVGTGIAELVVGLFRPRSGG